MSDNEATDSGLTDPVLGWHLMIVVAVLLVFNLYLDNRIDHLENKSDKVESTTESEK